jgi:hypothetical protein
MDRIETIGSLSEEKEVLEIEIMVREADVVRTVVNDPAYRVGDKPLAMNFIEATYKVTGLNGELVTPRRQLATVIARLEVARKSYDLLKTRIEVWRSIQANERSLT